MAANSPLGADDIIARHGRAIFAEVDGEVVALDTATGACFGLDGVASHIWRLIDPPASIAEVRGALVARYAVDPATCERQVIALIGNLEAQGLVIIQPGGPPALPGP